MELQKKTIPAIRWSFGTKAERPFLPSQLLERYLSKLPLKGFPYEEAVVFCDALRRLVGWREIGHTLGKYIKHQVQRGFLRLERMRTTFQLTRPAPCGPS